MNEYYSISYIKKPKQTHSRQLESYYSRDKTTIWKRTKREYQMNYDQHRQEKYVRRLECVSFMHTL